MPVLTDSDQQKLPISCSVLGRHLFALAITWALLCNSLFPPIINLEYVIRSGKLQTPHLDNEGCFCAHKK